MNSLLQNQNVQYRIRLYRGTRDYSELGTIAHRVLVMGDAAQIESETILQGFKEISKLHLRGCDLAPISLESRIETAAVRADIVAEFKANKVRALAKTSQGDRRFALDVADDCYENSSAYYVLGAIALGRIRKTSIQLVNVSCGALVRGELRISADGEIVETPWTTATCLSAELRVPDVPQVPPQRFYYQAEEPYFLLKVVCGPQVIELTNAVVVEAAGPACEAERTAFANSSDRASEGENTCKS